MASHTQNATTLTDESSVDFEAKYVHEVYEAIAPHFNDTRHREWPQIKDFLLKLPSYALVADIGCGNGKYLGTRAYKPSMIGFDYSASLCHLCNKKGYDVGIADGLNLPLHSDRFDAAISIAVIHHMSTVPRRIQALSELIRIVKVGGQVCVYVWSFEEGGRRKGKRPVNDAEEEALIPWNMPTRYKKQKQAMNVSVSIPVSDQDDKTRTNITQNDLKHHTIQQQSNRSDHGEENTKMETAPLNASGREFVYNRYYHLFKKDELLDLCSHLPNAKVSTIGFDSQNWYVILTKI